MSGSEKGDPLLGRQIGSYVVQRKLGEGGMGAVYELFHPQIGRRMALKVLHPEFARNKEVVRRFFAEARAANVIRHPNIVDITDLNQLEDGGYYIQMEFLEGQSLTDFLRENKALDPGEIAPIIIPLCSALGAAHAAGIVHRDLKPDNIHLVPMPDNPRFVKVLDFGIAKLSDELRADSEQPMTKTGAIMGTPHYMAPEQAKGHSKSTDPRTDVYAVGLILYEMLAGRRPFEGGQSLELLFAHAHNPPPPLHDWRPDLPEVWNQIVQVALAKEPEARFQSMAELGDAVQAALGGRPVARHPPDARHSPVGHPAAAPEPDSTGTMAGSARGRANRSARAVAHGAPVPVERKAPRARVIVPIAVALILAVTAVIIAMIIKGADKPEQAVATVADSGAGVAPPGEPAVPDAALAVPDAALAVPDAAAAVPDAAAATRPRRGTARVVVAARPWAMVYVDNVRKGPTPITVTVPAGREVKIKLVNRESDKRKTYRVNLEPGEKKVISWGL